MKVGFVGAAAAAAMLTVAVTASPAAADNMYGYSATQDSLTAYYDPGSYMNLCDYAMNDGNGAFVMFQIAGNPWRSATTFNNCERVASVPDGVSLTFYTCDWKFYAGEGRRAVNCGPTYSTNNS